MTCCRRSCRVTIASRTSWGATDSGPFGLPWWPRMGSGHRKTPARRVEGMLGVGQWHIISYYDTIAYKCIQTYTNYEYQDNVGRYWVSAGKKTDGVTRMTASTMSDDHWMLEDLDFGKQLMPVSPHAGFRDDTFQTQVPLGCMEATSMRFPVLNLEPWPDWGSIFSKMDLVEL